MTKYKNKESGIIYTPNGVITLKFVLGKHFEVVECKKSDGTFALVPTDKLKDIKCYKKIN